MCLSSDCEGDGVDRRDFLLGSTVLVGVGAFLNEGATEEKKQPPTRVLDDPSIQHGKVTFKHGGKDTFDGFLARPKAKGAFPAVLVVAGNRITEEYIPNTCAALALAGFVGLAPNTFHPLDGAKTPEEGEKALKAHTKYDVLQDIQVGADYLKAQPFVRTGGIGVLGFCFGGWMALMFGARSLEVDAVVAFHPGYDKLADFARLKSPVQLHHGTADRSIDVATSKKLEEVFKAQKIPVELFLYEGADHGFLAYTRPFYRPEDALLAWKRTTEFLGKHLKE